MKICFSVVTAFSFKSLKYSFNFIVYSACAYYILLVSEQIKIFHFESWNSDLFRLESECIFNFSPKSLNVFMASSVKLVTFLVFKFLDGRRCCWRSLSLFLNVYVVSSYSLLRELFLRYCTPCFNCFKQLKQLN